MGDIMFYRFLNLYKVVARINTLMSISEGLGPFICLKQTEWMHHMKKEVVGKLFF